MQDIKVKEVSSVQELPELTFMFLDNLEQFMEWLTSRRWVTDKYKIVTPLEIYRYAPTEKFAMLAARLESVE